MTPRQRPADHADDLSVCSPDLDATDALAVGQALRRLAREPRRPHGEREQFDRVGRALTAAARSQLAQREAIKAERAKYLKASLDGLAAERNHLGQAS